MNKFLEKYDSILENVSEGVIFTDTTGIIEKINSKASEILESEVSKIISKNIKDIFYINEDESRLDFGVVFNNVVETGSKYQLKSLKLHTFSGNIKDIEDSISPVYGDDLTIVGVAIIFLNVTEVLKKEHTIRYLEQRLEHLERMSVLSGFLSGISDNFSNLIMKMTNYLEKIENIQEDDEIESIIEKAFRDIDQSKNLVRKLNLFNEDSGFDPMPHKIKTLIQLNRTTFLKILPSNLKINVQLDYDFIVHIDMNDFDRVVLTIIEEFRKAAKNVEECSLNIKTMEDHVFFTFSGFNKMEYSIYQIFNIENILKRNSMELEKRYENSNIVYKLMFKN